MRKVPVGWHPRRGEVYLISVDKHRPALIVSSDTLNRYALDVCVVPIASVQHGRFALRVAIRAGEGGLSRNSWAKCDQVTTVDKADIIYPPLGKLSILTLAEIENGIRLALDLS